jgi:hypothetical protein
VHPSRHNSSLPPRHGKAIADCHSAEFLNSQHKVMAIKKSSCSRQLKQRAIFAVYMNGVFTKSHLLEHISKLWRNSARSKPSHTEMEVHSLHKQHITRMSRIDIPPQLNHGRQKELQITDVPAIWYRWRYIPPICSHIVQPNLPIMILIRFPIICKY